MNNSFMMFSNGKYKHIGVINGTAKSRNKYVWGGYNETGFAITVNLTY